MVDREWELRLDNQQSLNQQLVCLTVIFITESTSSSCLPFSFVKINLTACLLTIKDFLVNKFSR